VRTLFGVDERVPKVDRFRYGSAMYLMTRKKTRLSPAPVFWNRAIRDVSGSEASAQSNAAIGDQQALSLGCV
jgi:hypothetical protein